LGDGKADGQAGGRLLQSTPTNEKKRIKTHKKEGGRGRVAGPAARTGRTSTSTQPEHPHEFPPSSRVGSFSCSACVPLLFRVAPLNVSRPGQGALRERAVDRIRCRSSA